MPTSPGEEERELVSPVLLCDPEGGLNRAALGWSRSPLHRCNLRGRFLRKKRWNYWAFTTERHLFSATIADLDYAGLVFVYLADFATGEMLEATGLTPFGRRIELGGSVGDAASGSGGGIELAMRTTERATAIEVRVRDFHGAALEAELQAVQPERHETLNVVIPWDDRTFQFTSKQNTLPAGGSVRWRGREIAFEGEQAFGCLDFGRGIWPRRCSWNWGAASGRRDGRTIGLNLGGKWTDGTGATENGICIDGRLTKVSRELRWEYDRSDFRRPWRIVEPCWGSVDLQFRPFLERVARTNVGLVRSEVHQLFGTYEGAVTDASGARIALRDLVGWAEEHIARW